MASSPKKPQFINYLILNKMKTENAPHSSVRNSAKLTKWTRLASSVMAVSILLFSFVGQAQARILFEDDQYFNIQSSGIILDQNDNVFPGAASTLAVQNVTVNASAVGTGGDAQTVTINLADTNDSTCTVTGGTGTGAITLSCDDGTTSGTAADTSDIQSAINAEALFTASGGDATAAAALGTTNLANGEDSDTIDIQFGNDGTDALFSYDDTTQDLTLSTPGGDFSFSDDNLTTTGGVLMQGSSEFHVREIAGITSGVTPCTTVNEIAVDSTTSIMWICYDAGNDFWAPAGPQDFEAVYSYDADDTLTASGTFDIDAVGAVGIDSDAGLTFGGAGITATSDGDNVFSISSAGTAANALDLSAASGGITFTDANDSLTFTQTSAGLGNDLLNAGGEIYEATGTIGATIGGGETSTSLVHAINAVGTYAANIGAGANDNIDDVYNNSVGDGVFTMNIDNAGGLIFDIQGAGAGPILIQDDAGTIGEFTNAGAINFDPTSGQNFDVDTLGAGDIVLNSADTVDVDGANGISLDSSAGDITVDAEDSVTIASSDAGDTGVENVIISSGSNPNDAAEDGDDISLESEDDIYLYAGDDMYFDDAQLVGTVQLTDTATDWNVSFSSDGIIDNINALATLVGGGVEDLTFYPEWPDATVYGDGANNRGTLESFYDAAQDTNHYNWTTRRAAQQDINVQFMFVLPPDYNAIGANGLQFEYRTGAAGTGSNAVEIRMYERTGAGTTVACDAGGTGLLSNGTGAGGAFATGQITKATIDGSACVLTAGDVILIEAIFYDDTGAADFADVGYITLDYDNTL